MVSLGEELKRERVLREITLREISESTKISVRILEAIENDNYKILPGGVFNRNFLRAYAGFIGLDPEIIVRKYQQLQSGTQEDSLPIGLTTSSEFSAGARAEKKRIMLLVAFGVLLILALVAYWMIRIKTA